MVPAGRSFKIQALGARDPRGKKVHGPLNINFRVRNDVVTPYVVLDYSKGGSISPIKEVVLGPRNGNSESNIELFLNTLGLTNVTVRRSQVPYQR